MAKSSADRQREYRARNVTESPGGVTECNGNVTPDVTDFGGPDCQCGNCRQTRAHGKDKRRNHGEYMTGEQLDEAGIDGNRVSVPGDADYVTLTGRTQGEAGGQ